MVKAPTDADLIRLRSFLQRLESDARHAVEDAELWQHQIERLKGEVAYLEAARSRAFLAQIAIDYGAARVYRSNLFKDVAPFGGEVRQWPQRKKYLRRNIDNLRALGPSTARLITAGYLVGQRGTRYCSA